jgi:arginase
MASTAFDLTLAYPQWQGSGKHENLPRGAAACAAVCAEFAPIETVPLSSKSGDDGGIKRWHAIFDQFRSAQAILNERAPDRVLTAGGDCGVDVAVIDYFHRRYPDLTVIWVDAHFDANTPDTTPSGSFHGMPVAALLGSPPPALAPHLGAPIAPERFRYVGAYIGDEGDLAFRASNGLADLREDEPLSGPVHIHFDLDALDPTEFGHVAYPDGKLSVESGVALLRRVAEEADLVGLTITEFAPADEVAASAGSQVIARLCRAAAETAKVSA